jgi:hypothetical protein
MSNESWDCSVEQPPRSVKNKLSNMIPIVLRSFQRRMRFLGFPISTPMHKVSGIAKKKSPPN